MAAVKQRGALGRDNATLGGPMIRGSTWTIMPRQFVMLTREE